MSERVFGLLGSGEFEPWSAEVDRRLLARTSRPGPVLISPAAAAPEGEEVFDRWAERGLEHYGRAGISAEVLELRTRDDAFSDDVVAQPAHASMVFFSGGNPAYLAATLADTPFWAALLSSMDAGLAFAGCSAGVACLGERAPDSSFGKLTADAWRPGLRLFPGTIFAPHWDALDAFIPGLTGMFAAGLREEERLFAIDERTAVVGDGRAWEVVGSGAVRILGAGSWRTYASGQAFAVETSAGAMERTEEPA